MHKQTTAVQWTEWNIYYGLLVGDLIGSIEPGRAMEWEGQGLANSRLWRLQSGGHTF